jgi:hypothetical protein
MMIELGKQYKTRDGREVRIYAVDGRKDEEVHGAFLRKGEWTPCSWNKRGLWCDGGIDTHDLIEVKPRIKREVWVNMYHNGVDDELWFTKEVADQQALSSRIACVKLVIDCEEGEGL